TDGGTHVGSACGRRRCPRERACAPGRVANVSSSAVRSLGGSMKRSLRVFAVSLPLWASAAPLLAQVQTGSLLVRVTDERGGAVSAVGVTINSPVLVTSQSAAT